MCGACVTIGSPYVSDVDVNTYLQHHPVRLQCVCVCVCVCVCARDYRHFCFSAAFSAYLRLFCHKREGETAVGGWENQQPSYRLVSSPHSSVPFLGKHSASSVATQQNSSGKWEMSPCHILVVEFGRGQRGALVDEGEGEFRRHLRVCVCVPCV